MNNKIVLLILITSILITSGIGVAYASGAFPGENIFGETSGVNENIASGHNSAAFGTHTVASGGDSVAFNYFTDAIGSKSVSFGSSTTASGYQSAAFGYGTTAQPYSSFVIGQFNEISGTSYRWIGTDPLFVIGNGIDFDDLHNAVTVLQNGKVGIGITNPNQLLSVNGTIESTSGGFKFPDSTIQSTASISDITGITAGLGLLGGGTSGNVTLDVDTLSIQNRITGSCSIGSSISAINEDGTVSCETDDDPWVQTNSTISYTDGNVSIDNLTLTGNIIPDGDICIGKCQ